jgi:hypothetical protein
MDNRNLLLLKLLGQDFRNNWPFWKIKLRKSLTKWRKEVVAGLGSIILLGLCVWGGYVLVLYYSYYVWEIFSNTPMGEIFARRVSPEIGNYLTMILDLDLFELARDCVSLSLLATVAVGILIRITGILRLTYANRGVLGWSFWVMVCVALSAELSPVIPAPYSFQENVILFILPVSCLLAGSFRLSSGLVPEFTIVFQLTTLIRERLDVVRIRDLPFDQSEF